MNFLEILGILALIIVGFGILAAVLDFGRKGKNDPVQKLKEQAVEDYKNSSEMEEYVQQRIRDHIQGSVRDKIIAYKNLTQDFSAKSAEGSASNEREFGDFSQVQFQSKVEGAVSQEEMIKFSQNKIPSEWLRPKKNPETVNELTGKKVVITGDFSFKRLDLAKLLWECGADIDMAVSPKIDVVIAGQNAGWRKMEQVEKIGITLIDENRIKKIFTELDE